MSASEDKTNRRRALRIEAGVAIAAGAASFTLVPVSGATMHWGAEGEPGWAMNAFTYAWFAAVLTFVMGYIITQLVATKTAIVSLWAAPIGSAVLWVTNPALQGLWRGPGAIAAAAALGVAAYFGVMWLHLRTATTRSGDDSAGERKSN